jgi:hypothetical protein
MLVCASQDRHMLHAGWLDFFVDARPNATGQAGWHFKSHKTSALPNLEVCNKAPGGMGSYVHRLLSSLPDNSSTPDSSVRGGCWRTANGPACLSWWAGAGSMQRVCWIDTWLSNKGWPLTACCVTCAVQTAFSLPSLGC